ncbi:hypothetical protein CC77DRAFT_1066902 [Alternaria alternata]|uniref:Uncharacterized protein n=1 Tax=Alternaria alternata TaxID=5599 RepID=A0A177D5Z2_ALTAL|nr:hypothetical protein CC77DRAFT_1066902 [Alternaria alternata]KAH6851687.1 hypothetical protein B0T12DRAFT_394941 [Alternaria alternata]OAG14580.1 hypothetical protein CC77DRAFT_1066902 [Alternaria alternata]RYO07110.1 hypothetical protein AA0121_g11797 [Alternaria tenuissima]
MPVLTRFLVAFNGTRPHQGNGTVLPPGAYVQPIEDEVLWWKYTVGAVGLLAGIGACITGVYLCVVKWQERAARQASGAAPGAALPSDAPGPVEDYYELGAFNDPPPPYQASGAGIEPQQGRPERDEGDMDNVGRRIPHIARQLGDSADAPTPPAMTVSREHA